jgi:hypothetical protein
MRQCPRSLTSNPTNSRCTGHAAATLRDLRFLREGQPAEKPETPKSLRGKNFREHAE